MPSLTNRLAQQYQQQFGRPVDASDPTYAAYIQTALPSMIADDHAAYERSKNRWNVVKNVANAGTAALLTGGLGSLIGPGAAASGVSHGYSSPGIFGSIFGSPGATAATVATAPSRAFNLGRILNSDGFGLGVNSLMSILGNRSQANAQNRASQAQLVALDRQLAADAQNRAEQSRQFDVSQADSRAALAAQNELQKRQLEANEEERAYARRLTEDREARLAPYRANAARARMTLAQMLGVA